MKIRLVISAAVMVLLLSAVTGYTDPDPARRAREVVLTAPFEYDIDLETGQVCIGIVLPGACPITAFDFRFAFDSQSSNPTALFQNSPARIAILTGVPFAAVDSTAIANGLVLTDALSDVPFGPGDTAVLRTVEGNYFKVGLALCFTNDGALYPGCATIDNTEHAGVRFHYQQL
ncbi:MAG TPA: hypothetical protein VMQ62_13685 [Dongiaceae bacterium]|nr:hypothetical protein [Dongiaceae bacterium]